VKEWLSWREVVAVMLKHFIKEVDWPGAVAHLCNPSYLGGRGWENHDLRPAWENKGTPSQPRKMLGKVAF
jgi:hypothetical protein